MENQTRIEAIKEHLPKKDKKITTLSYKSVRRFLGKQGIRKIKKEAVDEIIIILEEILSDIATDIIIYTRHRKSKVSNKEDVLLATRK